MEQQEPCSQGHAGTPGHLAPLAVPPGLSPNTGGTSTTAEVRSNPALPKITHQQRFPTRSWWVQLQRGQLFGDPDAACHSGGGSAPGRIAHPGCCQPRGHRASGRPHTRWTPLGWPSRCRQPTSPAGREAHN